MFYCPRNAHHFNHTITPDQAREWCRTTNCNRDRKGCDYEHKYSEKLTTVNDGQQVVKPEQGRLF